MCFSVNVIWEIFGEKDKEMRANSFSFNCISSFNVAWDPTALSIINKTIKKYSKFSENTIKIKV